MAGLKNRKKDTRGKLGKKKKNMFPKGGAEAKQWHGLPLEVWGPQAPEAG